jgi:hypothetical protein
MKRCAVSLVGLISWTCALAVAACAAEPGAPRGSVLKGVTALEKPVTYSETKIPLGELVQRVAADTGASLTAAPEVADEPVAVVVKVLPARELLEQLADLLDYQWHRRLGLRTPNTEHRTPNFEIYQDLASKQREAALREARIRDAERRFEAQVRVDAEVAALTPEQIQALVAEGERHGDELAKLAPEPLRALLRSPEEQERRQRFGAARQLLRPIPRALARFVERLSPEQWAALRDEGRLIFSTDPQPGQLPLSPEMVTALRSSPPTVVAPGSHLELPDPEVAELVRQRDEKLREQWTAATGYRVSLLLDADHLPGAAQMTLTAGAAPIRGGEPNPSLFFAGGANLRLDSGPSDLVEPAQDQSRERRAALEKDPVVGVKQRFKPEVKPRLVSYGPGSLLMWPLRELLPDLAHAYDVQILSDAYSNSTSRRLTPADLPNDPIPLFELLDLLAGSSNHWDHQGRLIRLRSRTWFLDRPREIPLRLIRRWKALFDQHGALSLDEYARMATELTDAQLDSLPRIGEEIGLSLYWSDLSRIYLVRHALRLYASLSPGQRQTLERGALLTTAQMSPAQQELFLAAARQASLHSPTATTPEQWASGAFSVTMSPSIRTITQEGGSTQSTMESASPEDKSAQPAPRAPVGAPAPRARGPDHASAAPIRQRIIGVAFHLQSGPLEGEHTVIPIGLVVAPPS